MSTFTELLAAARTAEPGDRIDLRDPLATHGAIAIDAMIDWLDDPRLAAFAIRVIERVATLSSDDSLSKPAIVALRGVDRTIVSEAIGVDIAAALDRLSAGPRSPVTRGRQGFGDEYVATGEPPPAQGPCDISNRDGSACQNPGRHWVEGRWSCTTHFKALTRRGHAT